MVIPITSLKIKINNNYNKERVVYGTNGINFFQDYQTIYEIHLVSDPSTYIRK